MVRTLAVVSSTMRLRADVVITLSPILPVVLEVGGMALGADGSGRA